MIVSAAELRIFISVDDTGIIRFKINTEHDAKNNQSSLALNLANRIGIATKEAVQDVYKKTTLH